MTSLREGKCRGGSETTEDSISMNHRRHVSRRNHQSGRHISDRSILINLIDLHKLIVELIIDGGAGRGTERRTAIPS